MPHLFQVFQKSAGRRFVRQFPTGPFDAAQRRMEVCRIQTRQQKVAPVERRDLIQSRDDIFEPVRFDRWRGAGRTVKFLAKIVERTRTAAQLTNFCICVQPEN